MTDATERRPGARRHPGRRAVRASLAVRRHVPAAAHRRPRRRPRAGPAAAPDRRPRASRGRPRGRHVAHRRVHLPRASRRSGCRRRRWTASRPEFREGMAARAADAGRRRRERPRALGEAARHAPTCTSPSRPSPRTPRGSRPPPSRRARPTHELPGRRAGLAPGLLPARRPDGPRSGSRTASASPRSKAAAGPRRTRASGRSRPARSSWATPTRPASCRRCRRRTVLGRNGTYVVFRKLHTKVAAYRQYLRDRAASRAEEALLGAKMVGRWQSGAPLALAPDRDDPELGADPRRNNDFGYGDDPRGFKCPVGAHARRANPRDALDHDGSVDVRLHRMIRRGTSYGPMLPEGVLEDDGVDRGHHLRLRRGPPQAAVRVRQDPVAQRRHLHRRPAEKDPLVGPNDGTGQLHHPAAPDPPAAAGPAAVRGHPRRRVLLRARPDAPCAGWRSWTPDRRATRREDT